MATENPQDYRFFGDISKINPAEVPTDIIQKHKETLEDQIKALEQRYDQPNWFKVAAGFAKPQLGGFLASLGSAAEAMGENVEQQRAQQLPIAQMRAQISQANIMLNQKQDQNRLFQEWRQSGRPMDEQTYTRIASLGTDTEVAKAAKQFWEQARARVGTAVEIEQAAQQLPRLDSALQSFVDAAINPNADPKEQDKQGAQFVAKLDAARPPQIDQAQWNQMSRLQKLEETASYAKVQREAGMSEEAKMQQQASQAPTRLSLLGSIRDLALGVGLEPTTKMVDGKPVQVSGQQQMAAMLNYFGGDNPFEVLARAAADGKLGERLRDIDAYARQNAMSPAVRDNFQKLAKLLAENQISLRNATTNPTDASAMLQAAGSPNIGNSQTALVSLVDLIGHSEQNAIEKYKFVLDKRVPYRQLGVDPDYLEKQRRYAEEHRKIATSNPLVEMPSWYNPARSGGVRAPEQAAPAAAPVAAQRPAAPRPAARPATTDRVTLDALQRERERRQQSQP